MPITAQVSLYPLRQPHLTPAIERTLEVLRSHGLAVDPGTMSTLVSGEDDAVFAALKEAFQEVAQQGGVVMVVTLSNACPFPEPQ
ncbi:MAG TPA: YkoF family thiamine/hydroxymethylpyrimidine-binding protein [Dehalococcoidia bacterium]|nr:YkoF family thiamine/hydroxymethylpyrimidine-binding protein [Dehalococcoidia bacterium]